MKLEHLINLKYNLKEDLLFFQNKFNSFFVLNNWKIILLFVCLFFFLPFIPLFIIILYSYKYVIKYLFILFDILILDFINIIINSMFIKNLYNKIRNLLWFLFYEIIFKYCPRLFWWCLDKFTINFWMESVSVILLFFITNIIKIIDYIVKKGPFFKLFFINSLKLLKSKFKYFYKFIYKVYKKRFLIWLKYDIYKFRRFVWKLLNLFFDNISLLLYIIQNLFTYKFIYNINNDILFLNNINKINFLSNSVKKFDNFQTNFLLYLIDYNIFLLVFNFSRFYYFNFSWKVICFIILSLFYYFKFLCFMLICFFIYMFVCVFFKFGHLIILDNIYYKLNLIIYNIFNIFNINDVKYIIINYIPKNWKTNFIGLFIIKNIQKFSLIDIFNNLTISLFWQKYISIQINFYLNWCNLNYIHYNKYNLNTFLRLIILFIKNHNNIIFFINNNIVKDLYLNYTEKKIIKYKKLYLKNF